jgi:hypothetical protein
MKNLLTLSSALEVGTGIGLLVASSVLARMLLGATLDAPAALTVARVAGAALLSLGAACWLARHDGRTLVTAMLFYNITAVVVLSHAALGLGLSGIGLWPTVALHTGLAVWCATAVRSQRLLSPP